MLFIFSSFRSYNVPFISILWIAYDIYIGPYYEFYSFGIYVKEVWTKVTKWFAADILHLMCFNIAEMPPKSILSNF